MAIYDSLKSIIDYINLKLGRTEIGNIYMTMMIFHKLLFVLSICFVFLQEQIVRCDSGYNVGVGIWDMTGPSVEVIGFVMKGLKSFSN